MSFDTGQNKERHLFTIMDTCVPPFVHTHAFVYTHTYVLTSTDHLPCVHMRMQSQIQLQTEIKHKYNHTYTLYEHMSNMGRYSWFCLLLSGLLLAFTSGAEMMYLTSLSNNMYSPCTGLVNIQAKTSPAFFSTPSASLHKLCT